MSEQPTRTNASFPRHLGEYHGALNREYDGGMHSGLLTGFALGAICGVIFGIIFGAAIVWEALR